MSSMSLLCGRNMQGLALDFLVTMLVDIARAALSSSLRPRPLRPAYKLEGY